VVVCTATTRPYTSRMSDVADPIARFEQAFAVAKAKVRGDVTTVALATADSRGRPSVRMVLLKGVDQRGFVVFTNYGSRKANELDQNPYAALCFHWAEVEQQVRVEGSVSRASDAESDDYFASRARGSQIGAWASKQSEELGSRDELLSRVREIEARFPNEVPRPPFWGGYRITPERIEFWQGQASRLHDRDVYVRDGAAWRLSHLYP
jgi:pyridoxamine 5'-phosphate oxidase